MTPGIGSWILLSSGALLHRPRGRAAAAQPARRAALARDHAERGQPHAGRVLALHRRHDGQVFALDGHGRRRGRGRRRPRPDRRARRAASWCWTPTSCGACTDERRRLRLARPARCRSSDSPSTSGVGPSVSRRAVGLGRIALGARGVRAARVLAFIDLLGRDDSQRAIVSTGWTLALGRRLPRRREHPRRPALGRDAAGRHRRRLPDPRLLGRATCAATRRSGGSSRT